MYTIEKNIPMPPRRGDISIWPFKQMEVGDSFLASGKDEAKKAKQAADNYCYRHRDAGVKFSFRSLPDGSARVWRTA